jgi:serine/threonine protein kinase
MSANLEMQVMIRLKHPNILSIKESYWSRDDEGLTMVTEYCSLGALSGQINERKEAEGRKPFSENLVRMCLVDMARALYHLSEHMIAHLDLKP